MHLVNTLTRHEDGIEIHDGGRACLFDVADQVIDVCRRGPIGDGYHEFSRTFAQLLREREGRGIDQGHRKLETSNSLAVPGPLRGNRESRRETGLIRPGFSQSADSTFNGLRSKHNVGGAGSTLKGSANKSCQINYLSFVMVTSHRERVTMAANVDGSALGLSV